MHGYPEEIDLISLFECEPTLFDTTSKDFFYNEATYKFSNREEDFVVILSPSYCEVKIQVTQRTSNKSISLLDLKRVDKFEIKADKKDLSSVLLWIQNDDFTQTIEIDFKPKFKLILKEHFIR
ncbi:hypothetical protein [Peribacillus loiseleuriae]|uniref:hypothetical protein n=1 Tax=Peribacillus loiseleuriae TaxID=1679170 RepID=UPI003D039DC0